MEIQTGTSSSALPQSPGDAQRGRRLFLICAAAVIVVAAALRLVYISRYEVWLDEAYSFVAARQSIGEMLSALRLDNAPPLYFILLHYWMALFGDSATAMRSLSALFSTATVAVLVFWDTPWLPRTARLIAGLLLAITPLAIYYAQEARMYAMLMFFVLLSVVYLEKGLRTGAKHAWALCAIFTALSFYTSYAAVFLAPMGYAVIAVSFALRKDAGAARRALIGLVAAHVAAAALFAPWLPIFFRQPSAQAIQWIAPAWNADKAKPLLPIKSLAVMTTGGAYYPIYLRQLSSGPEVIDPMRQSLAQGYEGDARVRALARVPEYLPLVLMMLLAGFMLYMGLRTGGPFPFRGLLVAWVVMPLAVLLAISYLLPMYVVGRYEVSAVPAFAILCGIGLSRVRLAGAITALCVAAGLFFYSWNVMYASSPVMWELERVEALQEVVKKGDVVVCMSFEYAVTAYYAGEGRDDLHLMSFPRDTVRHSGWIDYDKWLIPPRKWKAPRDALYREANETLREAAAKTGPGGSVILMRGMLDGSGWAAAMMEAMSLPIMTMADAGSIEYDRAASRPDSGIIVLRVRR